MTVAQTDSVKDSSEAFAPDPKAEAKPIAAPKATKPKPAPVEEAPADDVVEEPVKVSKKVESPEVSAEITDLLDEWDV